MALYVGYDEAAKFINTGSILRRNWEKEAYTELYVWGKPGEEEYCTKQVSEDRIKSGGPLNRRYAHL
jgi:hypothetical protein